MEVFAAGVGPNPEFHGTKDLSCSVAPQVDRVSTRPRVAMAIWHIKHREFLPSKNMRCGVKNLAGPLLRVNQDTLQKPQLNIPGMNTTMVSSLEGRESQIAQDISRLFVTRSLWKTVDLAEWHRKQCQAKYDAENAAYSPPPQCFTLHHPTHRVRIKSNRREEKNCSKWESCLAKRTVGHFN